MCAVCAWERVSRETYQYCGLLLCFSLLGGSANLYFCAVHLGGCTELDRHASSSSASQLSRATDRRGMLVPGAPCSHSFARRRVSREGATLIFFFFSLSSRVPPAPGPVPSRSAQEFSRTTILLPLLRSRLLFTIWREARPSTRFANAARHYAGQHTLARAGRGRKGETTAAVRRCDAINPRRS